MELIPPDYKRCQAQKQTGNFMSFGPSELVRCKNKPTAIARGSNGPGSMSLCEDCKKICAKYVPGVKFTKIKLSSKSESK